MSYCHHCYESPKNLKRCSSCLSVSYCSSACQTSDWPIHLVDCILDRTITSADQLVAYVHRRYLPGDPETQRDFGFIHSPDRQDKIMRLEVYSKLILEHKVNAKIIHRWQKKGQLGEMIKQTFDTKMSSSERQREPYLWFCQHMSTFDTPPRSQDETKAWLNNAYREAWVLIGRSRSDSDETIQSFVEGLTEPQGDCFMFIAFLCVGLHPGPGVKGWKSFGLCGCGSLDEERDLCRQYKSLISQAGFDSFSQAYDSSSLPKLLSEHGLEVTNPFVLDVLANSPRGYKTVWTLKDFVCADHKEDEPLRPGPSISWDYGFCNCSNQQETKALIKAYKQVLIRPDADPLALHEACCNGKLFEYVNQFASGLKPEDKFRRLIKNVYPLPDPDA